MSQARGGNARDELNAAGISSKHKHRPTDSSADHIRIVASCKGSGPVCEMSYSFLMLACMCCERLQDR